jgi:ABC-2 type transport system ATP-binding protein
MTPALELRGLSKEFAASGRHGVPVRAVDEVNLVIEPGQVFGLLGPNGSGKSTTIKLILGLIAPTRGECSIFGVASGETEARRAVGYLPESPYFHRFLTGRELVTYHGRLSGMSGRKLRDRVDEVLAWAGIAAAADRAVGVYSKGMLQRIGLAQALVHRPRLVIMDEPTAGVDVAGAAAMMAMILRLKTEGATVLLTSHVVGQIEQVCGRVAVLAHGRVRASGALDGRERSEDELVIRGPELSPEDHAELTGWLGRRGCAIAPPGCGRRRTESEDATSIKIDRSDA